MFRSMLFSLLFVVLAAVQSAPAPEKGLDIAQKIRDARRGFGGEASEMELIMLNASGDRVTRRMLSRSIEVEGDGDRSLITFTWPVDVKDTQLLTWSHREGSDDQWLYLPSIQRVKRISSRNKSGSFMGSEFSYEDLGSQEVEQFTYSYLRDEDLDGRSTWVVERYPVDTSSGYSKQIVWYDKGYMRPLQIHYFDRKGELLKIATFSGFVDHGDWWRENRLEVKNVQSQKVSTIIWKQRELGKTYEPREFERTALGD